MMKNPTERENPTDCLAEKGLFEIDCVVDDGNGNQLFGKDLAKQCLREWESILAAEGLLIRRT